MTSNSSSEANPKGERRAGAGIPLAAKHGFWRQPATALLLLTLFAALVITPFLYVVVISLKSASEMGNSRLLPDALRELASMRNGEMVWVRAELSEEQSAALNTIQAVPVAAINPNLFARTALTSLPPESVRARRLTLEKPSIDARFVTALFEVPNDKHLLRADQAATLFYPGPQAGTWLAAKVVPVPRTWQAYLGRLFANYQTITEWQTLKAGKWLDWLSNGFPRWFLNSLFVALSTVLLGVFLDSLAGFAFAKYSFPFRRVLFALLLATIMIPYPVTLVPTFFIFAKLGFYNTYAALIIPGVVSAFGIFLVRQYVQNIPDDMLDAARVDGASDFGLYWRIILPTARPVLAALAVFRFIWQWNTYLYPLVLTNRDSMKTVQLGLATLEDAYGTIHYGVQMAGAALAVFPILLVYVLMQKHFVAGITLGSVKD